MPSVLDDSLPDIDSPLRTVFAMAPVGTPRRNVSLAGSSSHHNSAFTPTNGAGYYGSISSRPASGLPAVSSRSNTPAPGSSAAEMWQRFEQLKTYQGQMNAFMEELLHRYTCLEEQHANTLQAYNQACRAAAPSKNEEMLQQQCATLMGMLQREAFILVLIDGDGLIFQDELLCQGEKGGRKAAQMLHTFADEWARENVQNCPKTFKIVTRVFANVRGLAETCRRAGIVTSPEVVEDFVRSFTRQFDYFHFEDVGPGKDLADVKMKAEFELFSQFYQCRHIIFGCSHDNGFARLLDRYIFVDEIAEKLTLLEGVPFGKELAGLPFKKKKFEGLFRSEKLIVGPPDLLTDFSRSMHVDSRSNFNPSSGIFTPASQTPAPQTPAFSPSTAKAPTLPQHMPTPPVSVRGDLTRSSSIASGVSESVSTLAPPSTSMWATIARASAAKPLQDLKRPILESKPAKTNGPVLQRNKHGQRVDRPMEYDHEKVFELKKKKYCNQHYIGKGCCHWNAQNGNCPHRHEDNLSPEQLKWLRVVARETVCKKGTGCDDFNCIYGHHCPYPKMTEGSLRGAGCINGDNCRFAKEMHSMDTNVTQTIRAEDDIADSSFA